MNSFSGARSLINTRMLKFLGTGLLNTIFGYAIYALLVFVNVPALFALLTATVVGVVFNYFSFGRLVFRGHSGRLVFARFVMAYVVIYAANALLLNALTNEISLNAYVAQAICVPPSVLLSWLLMNHWVYKKD